MIKMGEVSDSRVGGLSGDTLEIRIKDSKYHTYFKMKANVNNVKALRKILVDDLKHFGVDVKKIVNGKGDDDGRWW